MKKKYIFYFLLLLISTSLNAQVRAFVGASYFRHTDFEANGYVEGLAGLEVKVFKFLKPELAVSYYFGRLQDNTKIDALGNVISIGETKAEALNFSFVPKICISCGESSAGDGLFQIMPRYSISKIEAQEKFTTVNQNNPSQSITNKQTVTEWQHSIGIGVGVDIMLSDKNYDSLAINLYYTGIDMGKAINQVERTNTRYDSRTLGAGMNYYFGFKKKKE